MAVIQIQARRDTETLWSSTNPVLANGEFGYDTTNKILKIGDSTSTWLTLPTNNSRLSYRISTVSYTIQPYDDVIAFNNGACNVIGTLPNPVGIQGKVVNIKKNSSGGSLIIQCSTTTILIDDCGSLTIPSGVKNLSYSLISDNSGYRII